MVKHCVTATKIVSSNLIRISLYINNFLFFSKTTCIINLIMFNLFMYVENYTNAYNIEILTLIFFLSILCGILVIVSKNPIVSVLFLIGLFFTVACYLAVLDISFIALSYLLVYVGAISILFLFILMLINIRVSELISDSRNSIPLAIIVSFIFYYSVYNIMPYDITGNQLYNINTWFESNNNNNNQLLFAVSESWEANLTEISHISTLGNIMYTNYFMWLILTSFILLLAMVGAIIITIKQDAD